MSSMEGGRQKGLAMAVQSLERGSNQSLSIRFEMLCLQAVHKVSVHWQNMSNSIEYKRQVAAILVMWWSRSAVTVTFVRYEHIVSLVRAL